MHQQSERQLQERLTSLGVPDVLASAEMFFSRLNGIYTAFLEKRGSTYIVMRGQGNEEVIIAAAVANTGTLVSASTYFFDQQVTRFLDSLPVVRPCPETESVSASDTARGEVS